MTKDVTEPNRPVPPTHTGLELSRKQDPATPVSGFTGAGNPPPSKPANPADEGAPKNFKLPEKVSTEEMKGMGRRYGNTW
jgi:hypothetical protein